MTTWTTDTVLMPVPLDLAPRVAEFLQGLRDKTGANLADSPDSIRATDPLGVVVPDQGTWTEAMVRDLADGLTYEGVIALLDRCATEPEQWILKSVVEQASDISPIQLRNELGALSKLTKRLFGGDPTWPMQWRKDKGKYYYRMSSQVADWWLAARSGGGR